MSHIDKIHSKTYKLAVARETLGHYLTGYGRANPEELLLLRSISNWQRFAKTELEKRMTNILAGMDDEVLLALAEGTINFPEEIDRAYQQLRQASAD